jgi:protoporphyrinogen oxidase
MQRISTVVVGGGVTGLALAHRLLVLGGGKIGVTVLEAQDQTGGMCTCVTCVSAFRKILSAAQGARSMCACVCV